MNPSNVSNIPLLAGWVLMNLRIKIGAITIAIGTVGKKLLYLVNKRNPKPSMNKTTGKYFLDLFDLVLLSTIMIIFSVSSEKVPSVSKDTGFA
jgi:hypothetical protein